MRGWVVFTFFSLNVPSNKRRRRGWGTKKRGGGGRRSWRTAEKATRISHHHRGRPTVDECQGGRVDSSRRQLHPRRRGGHGAGACEPHPATHGTESHRRQERFRQEHPVIARCGTGGTHCWGHHFLGPGPDGKHASAVRITSGPRRARLPVPRAPLLRQGTDNDVGDITIFVLLIRSGEALLTRPHEPTVSRLVFSGICTDIVFWPPAEPPLQEPAPPRPP